MSHRPPPPSNSNERRYSRGSESTPASTPQTTPKTTPTQSATSICTGRTGTSMATSRNSRYSGRRGILQSRTVPTIVPTVPLLEESPVKEFRETPRQEPTTEQTTALSRELLTQGDDTFSIARDFYHHCGFSLLALLLLGMATAFLLLATLHEEGDPNVYKKRFGYFSGALVSAFICLAVCVRFGTPTSVRVMRMKGAWSISLQRRGLPPKIRPLLELDAFVETFGYCGKSPVRYRGKKVGMTTSSDGAMQLFFCASLAAPPLAMVVSLQDPLAFLTKLRDILIGIGHPLASVTSDYVADWDAESDDASVTCTVVTTSISGCELPSRP